MLPTSFKFSFQIFFLLSVFSFLRIFGDDRHLTAGGHFTTISPLSYL